MRLSLKDELTLQSSIQSLEDGAMVMLYKPRFHTPDAVLGICHIYVVQSSL
jgi:hypothetical protein